MVRRSLTNGNLQKGTPKKGVPQKNQPNPVFSSENSDIKKLLDAHTRHLNSIDETLSALKNELTGFKQVLVPEQSSSIAKPKTADVKATPVSSWHSQIDLNREYTQKEIIDITKISQPTLSMAKVRGHIVTRSPPGIRGWVVKGSDLIEWDNNRAVNTRKKQNVATKGISPKKKTISTGKTSSVVAKKGTTAVTVGNLKGKKPLVVQKKETKALAVQAQSSPGITVSSDKKPVQTTVSKPVAKTGTASAVAKKTIPTTKSTAKPGNKPVTKTIKKSPGKTTKPVSSSKEQKEQQIPIPEDIPDRIIALTMKKVVTQTQFGNDVGLPQKVIYEIATRKLSILNPVVIQKIINTLKTYES